MSSLFGISFFCVRVSAAYNKLVDCEHEHYSLACFFFSQQQYVFITQSIWCCVGVHCNYIDWNQVCIVVRWFCVLCGLQTYTTTACDEAAADFKSQATTSSYVHVVGAFSVFKISWWYIITPEWLRFDVSTLLLRFTRARICRAWFSGSTLNYVSLSAL